MRCKVTIKGRECGAQADPGQTYRDVFGQLKPAPICRGCAEMFKRWNAELRGGDRAQA